MVALAPSESELEGSSSSCRTGRYEGAGLGSLSLALSLVGVSANPLGLWILGLPATPATNGLVHPGCPLQGSEVLLLLVPWGSTEGVLTAIGTAGPPPVLLCCQTVAQKHLEGCSYKLPSWIDGRVQRRSLEPVAQPSSRWPRCPQGL